MALWRYGAPPCEDQRVKEGVLRWLEWLEKARTNQICSGVFFEGRNDGWNIRPKVCSIPSVWIRQQVCIVYLPLLLRYDLKTKIKWKNPSSMALGILKEYRDKNPLSQNVRPMLIRGLVPCTGSGFGGLSGIRAPPSGQRCSLPLRLSRTLKYKHTSLK